VFFVRPKRSVSPPQRGYRSGKKVGRSIRANLSWEGQNGYILVGVLK
jgi:hypothetical protein